ncbi:DUF2917 domain-containing protein [Polaromonas sp. SM01]|uniref:DUF2917 domain-containing protein n=1 Tax=Polaromonas sp. SM01 TaxID=3085630 RepID=UPI0029824521|nr:DUF2917 domain-containing protein [Polaromonas sp. SM01]MDW5444215.1 DUF2917 domain-containing protein [Polaromonas sp. SM01]
MNPLNKHSQSSFTCTDAVAGCWKLGDGRALTLRPTESGVLRIAHGRVWITYNNAQQDDGVRGGDHFLGAGDDLKLLPGQVLVMESWGAAKESAAYFSWDPLPATVGITVSPATRRVLAVSGVAQPLRDLRVALGLATTASGRLVLGLAGLAGAALLLVVPRSAIDLVADRARTTLAARAFKAQANDSRAHCAIN